MIEIITDVTTKKNRIINMNKKDNRRRCSHAKRDSNTNNNRNRHSCAIKIDIETEIAA